MNSQRLQSRLSGLEKDITNCEAYLSKVIKGKVDKSKSNTYKSPQKVVANGVRERSAMPFVTGPSLKAPLPPKRRSNHKVSPKSSYTDNHVLCKEVFENNNATVEVTVKTRALTNDKSRKRPRSNAFVCSSENNRPLSKDDVQKQCNVLFEPPAPSKLNKNVGQEKKCHSHSRYKHKSWASILKDKNAGCIIHREKAENDVDSKEILANDRRSSHSIKHSNKHLVSDNSLTSSITDCSSRTSDQESFHYVNRSIQCQLPENSVHINEQKDMNPNVRKYGSGNGGGGSLPLLNPVRTLKFLIKELNGKLQKCDGDGNITRIIADMQHALMRIPSEVNSTKMKENAIDIPTRDETVAGKSFQAGFVPLEPAEISLSNPVFIPKAAFPEQGSFTLEGINMSPHRDVVHKQTVNKSDAHSYQAPEPVTPPIKQDLMIQRELELKCSRLELSCRQLELTCCQQEKERDSLNEKLKRKKEELNLVINKEKDYLTTIGYLKSNLESMTKRTEGQSKTISEFIAINTQLKEENKMLMALRDSHAVLTRHLKDSNEERERIHSQLQIMKLEREKFEILMNSKTKELEKFKKELRDIQTLASEQLVNFKAFASNHKTTDKIDKVIRDVGTQSVFSDDSDLDSLTTEITLFLEKAQTGEEGEIGKQPICSSPTSSVPSTLGIYPSWQKISRISSSSQKDIKKKSSLEVLVLSPAGKTNMKDSGDDTDVDARRSFPFVKPESPEFKSFLVDSLSHNAEAESGSESSRTEPKTCQDLKDELRSLFDRIKKQARMGVDLTLPSPPRQYSDISEPGGMSQWSEASGDSVQNSLYFSVSNIEINKAKYDFTISDTSVENKLGEEN